MLVHMPVSRDLMRRMNRSLILNLIRLQGPISRARIARESGLSAATVSALVTDLIQNGLVYEREEGDSSGGRPPILLTLNPLGKFVIGISLKENRLVAVMVNLDARVVDSAEIPLAGSDPQTVIDAIVETVSNLSMKNNVQKTQLLGVGIGLTGVVDPGYGSVRLSPDFGWEGLPIRELVRERLEVPLFIDTDIYNITLAEEWFGMAKDVNHFLAVRIGPRVEMGIVVNGRLYRGRDDAGGLGHTVLDPQGKRCSCGKRGCLETLIADHYLVDEAQKIGRIAEKVQTVDDLRMLAENGDPDAQAIYTATGENLGRAIANLVNIFDPQMILLTGEGVKTRDLFQKSMFDSIKANTVGGSGQDPEINFKLLEDLDWAWGAAGLVLKAVFDSPMYDQEQNL